MHLLLTYTHTHGRVWARATWTILLSYATVVRGLFFLLSHRTFGQKFEKWFKNFKMLQLKKTNILAVCAWFSKNAWCFWTFFFNFWPNVWCHTSMVRAQQPLVVLVVCTVSYSSQLHAASAASLPHLCSKQIKSTWSESLRESALILSWLCSLGETCQHNCCHKSRENCGLEGPLFDYYFAMNKNDKSQLTKWPGWITIRVDWLIYFSKQEMLASYHITQQCSKNGKKMAINI